MNRVSQRFFLLFVCALALVLIPASYSWAQQANPAGQQDTNDRDNVNPDSVNNTQTPDLNQPNLNQAESAQENRDAKSDQSDIDREKPGNEANVNPETEQNQNQNPNLNQSPERNSTSAVQDSQSTSTSLTNAASDPASSSEGLPATAGELPLLALIGVLSLAPAAGTRVLARSKSR